MQCKTFIVIFLYILAINLFGLFIKLLEYTNLMLQFNIRNIDQNNLVYDYIVVGCGSAGAVIARRLAADKNATVLILEAGPYGNPLLEIPPLGILLQNTHFSWQHTTESQNQSCLGLKEQRSFWPSGKIVGGTGMLNNMIYVRGHKDDFDDWFENKNGYSFLSDIQPYFKKLENYNIKYNGKRSTFLTNPPFNSALQSYLLQAAKSLGFPILNSTLNCESGFGTPKVNQHHGARWTTSHYIIHDKYPNIFLYTDREVQEILFHDNFEAYGVKYKYSNKLYTSMAKKGIILSAGVIGTPKILLQSGLGPKHHLDDVNISTKINLPVGENLQDHVTTGFDLVLLNQSVGIHLDQMMSPLSAFDYFWNGHGPWTTAGCEVLGFYRTKYSNGFRPDIQFMLMPLGVNEDSGLILKHLFGIKDEVWSKYFALLSNNRTITLLPILLHPKSRGTVRLKEKDFSKPVSINPNYLSNSDDVKILMHGIQIIKQFVNSEIMQRLGATFNTNHFPGCEHLAFDTEPYWECYIRHLTITAYHPIGTCKMGSDKDDSAVVTFQFEVKGTNNLYVVDGSVLPNLPSGNVNGAILILAEIASDVLKLKNYLNQGKCFSKEIFIVNTVC